MKENILDTELCDDINTDVVNDLNCKKNFNLYYFFIFPTVLFFCKIKSKSLVVKF